MKKLKNCPFCGGKPFEFMEMFPCSTLISFTMVCVKCGAKVWGITQKDAHAKWNNRVDEKNKYVTRKEWSKKHSRCPKCGSNVILETLVGILEYSNKDFEDNINSFECGCGCEGKIKELVE